MSTRFIDTSPITPIAGLPFRGVTLDHLKTGNDDAIASCCISIIGKDYAPSKHHIMSGCVNSTPAGPAFTISAGYIFSGGFLYKVDATTFTPAMGQTAVCVLDPTYNVLADPTIFTDGSSHSVHVIRKIKIQSGASGSGLVDFANLRIVGMEPFRAVGTPGNPAFQNGWGAAPPSNDLFFRKDFSTGIVYINGIIDKMSWDGFNSLVTVLPIEYYPPIQSDWNSLVDQTTGGAVPLFDNVHIFVTGLGDLRVALKQTYAPSLVRLNFDGFNYFSA